MVTFTITTTDPTKIVEAIKAECERRANDVKAKMPGAARKVDSARLAGEASAYDALV